MAEFATIADMLARFDATDLTQLTDGDGAPDDVKLEARLVTASNIVRGYVSKHYRIASFPAVPALLIDCTCDIAHYRLYQTAVPEEIKDRYKDAIRQLEAIAKGTLKLDDGEAVAEARPGAVLVPGAGRVFSREKMSGF